jgi:hypothetical protein
MRRGVPFFAKAAVLGVLLAVAGFAAAQQNVPLLGRPFNWVCKGPATRAR